MILEKNLRHSQIFLSIISFGRKMSHVFICEKSKLLYRQTGNGQMWNFFIRSQREIQNCFIQTIFYGRFFAMKYLHVLYEVY